MLLMMLALRLYPRRFRDAFEAEMLSTFNESQLEYQRSETLTRIRFLIRELIGVLAHVPAEWVKLHRFKKNVHRLTSLMVTVALQSLLYSCLLPIGPTATRTTGSWLRTVAIGALSLAFLTEVTVAAFSGVRKYS